MRVRSQGCARLCPSLFPPFTSEGNPPPRLLLLGDPLRVSAASYHTQWKLIEQTDFLPNRVD